MRALVMLCGLAASTGALCGVAAEAAGQAQCWDSHVLLDPARDAALRQEHLARLERIAVEGDRWSRYVLGSLYRLGMQHPARLVEQDLAKAGPLLSRAALAGHRLAMAAQAELELEAGRPLAGMMWAQAFARYAELFGAEPEDVGTAYPAWLIRRMWDALASSDDPPDAQLVEETFNGFVADYGNRIAAAVQAGRPEGACPGDDQPPLEFERDGGGVLAGAELSRNAGRAPRSPGVALLLVAAAPDGAPEEILVVDTLPEDSIAAGLMRNARRMRFNAVDPGSPTRWGLVPVHYDDGSIRLRD